MEIGFDALFTQSPFHFCIENIGDEGGKDDDVFWGDAMRPDEIRHVIDCFFDHFGVVMAGGKGEGRTGTDGKVAIGEGWIGNDLFHGEDSGTADEGVLKFHANGTEVAEGFRGEGIAAHEGAVSAVLVGDEQDGTAEGGDFSDKVVCCGDFFFEVVKDEMVFLIFYPVLEGGMGKQVFCEDFELHGIVQEVVFETGFAVEGAAFLRLVKYGEEGAVTGPGLLHVFFIVFKGDFRGCAFVHGKHNLVEDAGWGCGECVEVACFAFGANEFCHDDLGCFDGEEEGIGFSASELCLSGDDWPE